MQSKNRHWKIKYVNSPHELATLITTMRVPLCEGFLLDQYLFLNDSQFTSQAVYAVCRQCIMVGGDMFQAVQQFSQKDFSESSYIECLDEIVATLTEGCGLSGFLDTVDFHRSLLK